MADSPQPAAPSKAMTFARRSTSTLLLWILVAGVFSSRLAWANLGLVAVLAWIATLEYFRMLRAAGVVCFPRFGLLLAVAYTVTLYSFFLRGVPPLPELDALAAFIALAGAFTLQLRYQIKGIESLLAVAANVLGFVYIAVMFNFTARVMFLPPDAQTIPGRISDSGAFLVLWLLAVTKFTDMGAYLTGSLIGRHKMIPHVSPGKTWEGFGGALVFSQLAGIGLFLLFPTQLATLQHLGHVVALGFLLALLAVIGDLAESVVKRSIHAKDSGRMLPGIGGSLDLIDSVCFTAPALYFYLKWLPPLV